MVQPFVHAFERLHAHTGRSWTPLTCNKAPYKPILLLAVLDGIANGRIDRNRIVFDDDLEDACDAYRHRLPPEAGALRRWYLPFFHLRYEKAAKEPIWRLEPQPGKERALSLTDGPRSRNQLHDLVAAASLHPALFALATNPVNRTQLREALYGAAFAPELWPAMRQVSATMAEAADYERLLRARLNAPVDLLLVAEEDDPETAGYDVAARETAFRALVLGAYERRCAVCGEEPRDPEGRSLVEAVHLAPRALYDDDPRAGLALCPVHAEAVSGGVLGVGPDGVSLVGVRQGVLDDPALALPADRRLRVIPADRRFLPAPDVLAWHRAHVLRAG